MITQLAIVLVLFGTCYGRSDSEVKGWFLSLAVTCSNDFPIESAEFAMMKAQKIPDSSSAKCLMACIYKKADMFDDKGNYDLEKTYKMVQIEFGEDPARLENARRVFGLCKKVNEKAVTDGEKGCERAYFLSKCLTENAPMVA